MRTLRKVSVLVGIQIALIATSFAFLAYTESQSSLNGNMINIAGKNRLLANSVHLELNRALFHTSETHPHVAAAATALEGNILLLKTGGTADGVTIPPLPAEFESEHEQLYDMFLSYRLMVDGLLGSKPDFTFENVERARIANNMLVDMSDLIVEGLGSYSESISAQHMVFQILLGLVNILVLVVMMIFIWRIVKRHAESIVRTEKFEIVGKFASVMAHDIRNPLGAMRNSLEIIQRSDLPSSVDSEMQRINRSIWRISHQVEGVLNYVRAVPIIVRPESVTAMLRKSVDLLPVPDNVSLVLPGDGDDDADNGNSHSRYAGGRIVTDAVVECDSEKLEFVFANLILNAIQEIGNDTGYIKIRIKSDGSALDKNNHDEDAAHGDESGADGRGGSGDGYVVIEFENSGFIPAEDLQHVFDPLFTTKMNGTGLGLTSCTNIVNLHNGDLSVLNTGRSVVFTVRLPRTHAVGGGGRKEGRGGKYAPAGGDIK